MSSVDKNQTAAQAEESVPAGDERATFEANWRARNPHIPLNSRLRDDGRYGDHLIQKEWEAWQARAARAPADNVQEDAALLDWLEQHDGRYYNLDKVVAIVGTGFFVQSEGNMPQMHSTLREAIDAARKQGASHDR